MSPSLQLQESLLSATTTAIRQAAGRLLAQQNARGYWCGELTADTTLESDFILLQLWMYPPENGVWNPPSRPLIDKAVQSILDRQLSDGRRPIEKDKSRTGHRLEYASPSGTLWPAPALVDVP